MNLKTAQTDPVAQIKPGFSVHAKRKKHVRPLGPALPTQAGYPLLFTLEQTAVCPKPHQPVRKNTPQPQQDFIKKSNWLASGDPILWSTAR